MAAIAAVGLVTVPAMTHTATATKEHLLLMSSHPLLALEVLVALVVQQAS
jgi:hypothetical protein